jgi:benzodiazapine receptor
MTKTSNRLWVCLGSIIGVELVGFLSGILAGDIKAIYHQLTLPPLSPPSSLFGIVWPLLYLMMGITLFLLIQTPSPARKSNLILFGAQLFLNFIWSIVFFGASNRWISFGIIIVLDALLILCIAQFRKSNRFAAYLLVPYLIWILFATYLTLGTAILN